MNQVTEEFFDQRNRLNPKSLAVAQLIQPLPEGCVLPLRSSGHYYIETVHDTSGRERDQLQFVNKYYESLVGSTTCPKKKSNVNFLIVNLKLVMGCLFVWFCLFVCFCVCDLFYEYQGELWHQFLILLAGCMKKHSQINYYKLLNY